MPKNCIYFFSIRGKYFAYDSHSTFCVELDSVALTILPELLSGINKGLERKYAHVYPKSKISRCIKECRELLASGNFGIKPIPYRHRIQDNVASVCLHIAHNCNLNCEYCYADSGTFGDNRLLMSREVMRKAVDFAFAHSGDIKAINIGFFGGEPLLNFRLIKETVEYGKKKANTLNKRVTFSMASNAVLLTPSIMDFISKEKFSLLFSLDGPGKIHDRMRKTRNGEKTHSIVIKNVKKYLHNYADNFTVRGTFTRTTPNFSEQVLFLNKQGFKSVSVEPAQLDTDNIHSITTPGEILRIKLEYDKLADVYLERFNRGNPLHFFHFDHCLTKLLHPQPSHTECGAGGRYIAVTPNGKIFPCFETVAEKENCIGCIDSGFDKRKRRIFQCMYVDKRKECAGCWLRYFCGGGCHAFNIRYNNNIKIPYKPHCEFIKYRFKLAAWILSEITKGEEKAVKKLKKHLQIE